MAQEELEASGIKFAGSAHHHSSLLRLSPLQQTAFKFQSQSTKSLLVHYCAGQISSVKSGAGTGRTSYQHADGKGLID
ncbi:hypothetical protein QQF64_005891 [Cirrhinus molitorella]|uniref:Uncharacterized protein n=1 Tax=Cirrhinus molitorella TaxID=172907 RepID=A0ABR3MDK6_9TELE